MTDSNSNSNSNYDTMNKKEDERDDIVTAVDYIENQKELEKEARELMPYDPNECTYVQGELRQPLFACLTCSSQNDNQPIGVCYSCSIQCHLQHELVELFTKRSFECDCGTTRMKNTIDGACKLRRKGKPEKKERKLSNVSTSSNSGHLELPAEDIPSESNTYNQNYFGRFCGCKQLYNPLEETGHMIQCYFGFTCGEDWYHDRCIMGVKALVDSSTVGKIKTEGENILEKLSSPGLDAMDQRNQLKAEQEAEQDPEDLLEKLQYFPKLETFDEFICWKCVDQFRDIFEELDSKFPGVIMSKLPRFDNIVTVEDWYNKREESLQPNLKKLKTENSNADNQSYSIFLGNDFRYKLLDNYETLDHESKLYKFLNNNSYLFKDDPIFKPPEDESEEGWSTTDMGAAEALHSLPRDRAIESIQAYDKIRSKLREFFKPYAQQGKIVTEDEVRNFFGHIDDKVQDSHQ